MAVQYVGLDVSQAKTAVCVIGERGERLWEGNCASTPTALAATIAAHAPFASKVALETGPLAVWHWHALWDRGVPVVCLHAREAKAALSLQPQKTDRNDARGLAQIVRTGWYHAVQVRSMRSHELRVLLIAHKRLTASKTAIGNQIRGLLKTFGVVLSPGKGGTFERQLDRLATVAPQVATAVKALRTVWHSIQQQLAVLRQAIQHATDENPVCRLLESIPGVGAQTALAFVTSVDNPCRFRHARDLGPFLGLTPRRYQSGEVDRSGHISKTGDRLTRSLLFEAAGVLLTRQKADSELRTWATGVWHRSGYSKARVALARKLAIVMLTMWRSGQRFQASPAH